MDVCVPFHIKSIMPRSGLFKEDRDILEQFQRRTTRMTKGLELMLRTGTGQPGEEKALEES